MNTEESYMGTDDHTSDEHEEADDARVATKAVADLDERVMMALHAASDKKAVDPVVLDLRQIASFTDYFVIASGTNARQVQAIADAITETLKRAGTREMRVEGYATAEWVLLDYGDFVVHIFEAKARTFFDLERLWRDAQRIPLTPQLLGESPLVITTVTPEEA